MQLTSVAHRILPKDVRDLHFTRHVAVAETHFTIYLGPLALKHVILVNFSF